MYLHIRLSLTEKNQNKQLALMTIVIGSSGLMALLSKENAPSLFFYLLALEYTL